MATPQRLTHETLEAAAAVSGAAVLRLIVRAAEDAPDYLSLPPAIKDLHSVQFLATYVRRDGERLEATVRRFGVTEDFLKQSVAGLTRIGAHQHRDILLAAVQALVHFEPGLAVAMHDLGLTPVERADSWTLTSRWADAPDLTILAAWHAGNAFADFTSDPPTHELGPTLTPPRDLVATPSRHDLITRIEHLLGRSLTAETPLASIPAQDLARLAEAFALPASPLVRGDETITGLLNHVYDVGRPWALT